MDRKLLSIKSLSSRRPQDLCDVRLGGTERADIHSAMDAEGTRGCAGRGRCTAEIRRPRART